MIQVKSLRKIKKTGQVAQVTAQMIQIITQMYWIQHNVPAHSSVIQDTTKIVHGTVKIIQDEIDTAQ